MPTLAEQPDAIRVVGGHSVVRSAKRSVRADTEVDAADEDY
jgi:hypothetical protein